MRYGHISVAIPVLAEYENIPHLVESLRCQSFKNFDIYICVNNREGWADDGDEQHCAMYHDNQKTLQYLQSPDAGLPLTVIDRSSPQKGWQGKQHGVGWARKILFETISNNHNSNELIVSLDADTSFSNTYLESVIEAFNSHPGHSALCVPYYHPLSGNDTLDRPLLRYETYMRHYLLNFMAISSPYAFSALGSAMAFPLWAYKRVGGITPLQGGEDFYLMQKFAKTGQLLLSCNDIVKPQGRTSARVPFGTGPAIAKGIDSMDIAYPLYPIEGFRAVADTYAMFPHLYDEDVETPMSDFLRQQLKTDDLWQPLRKNFKTRELFIHACSERVDGLRILQFLKTFPLRRAEAELETLCKPHGISMPTDFNFRSSSIADIDKVRNGLFHLEQKMRFEQDNTIKESFQR